MENVVWRLVVLGRLKRDDVGTTLSDGEVEVEDDDENDVCDSYSGGGDDGSGILARCS